MIIRDRRYITHCPICDKPLLLKRIKCASCGEFITGTIKSTCNSIEKIPYSSEKTGPLCKNCTVVKCHECNNIIKASSAIIKIVAWDKVETRHGNNIKVHYKPRLRFFCSSCEVETYTDALP